MFQMSQMAKAVKAAIPKPKTDSIMIDMETMATRADAVILSIGAVKFQRETDYIDNDAFYAICSIGGQEKRHMSPDTLAWWVSQDAKAKSIFLAPEKVSLGVALGQLKSWCDDDSRLLWANGADFDIPLILHALDTHGFSPLVRYYNHRCYRTMKNEYTMVPQPDFQGTAHNALMDAMHQAKHLQAIYKFKNEGTILAPSKGFSAKKG